MGEKWAMQEGRERLGDFNCHESKQVGGSRRMQEQRGSRSAGRWGSSPVLAAWGGGGRCLFGLSPPGVRVGAPRLWAHPLLARDSSSSGSHAEYSPDPFASSWTGLERLRAWEPAACRFGSQFESKLYKLILLLNC